MAGGTMNLDDATLVVIDVQNDFCPGGALEVPAGDAVVPVINRIAPKFSARIGEGFECAVIEDACRGIDLDGSMDAAWEQMAAANVARVDSRDI